MKKVGLITGSILMLPMVASAQFGGVDTFFNNIGTFINNVLIPLIFALALLVFLWGMYLYFIQGGASDDSREKGRRLVLWSIIAFVLMVSIWGIVNIIASGLFPDQSGPDLPSSLTR